MPGGLRSRAWKRYRQRAASCAGGRRETLERDMALSLDTLTPQDVQTRFAEQPALPPEAPLPMPVQSLSVYSRQQARKPLRRRAPPWLVRAFVFAGSLSLTGWGAFEMYKVVSVSGVTFLQWMLVALFTINFSWIALAFTSALVGFAALLVARRERPAPTQLSAMTAVVMPVYNEATARVYASLEAMIDEIRATGLIRHFEFFILSDSTQPDAW